MEYQPNQMKNTNPFCIVFEVLKVLLIIIAATRSFISCCCMLDFTSAQVAYPCLIKYRDVPNSVTKFYSQIADQNLWRLFFRYCSVKRMPGPFCQANSVAGNTYSTIIVAARWTVFLKLCISKLYININKLMLFLFFWKVV